MGAARTRAAKAGEAARSARTNPYVKRLVEDEELRRNIRAAYQAVHDAYGRLSNGKPATRALLEDKRLQRDLREAAAALREAGTSLKEGPRRRRRRGGLGRKLMLLAVGAGLAVALSESLRGKVLDALFGAEDEFEYTPTPAPAAAAESVVA